MEDAETCQMFCKDLYPGSCNWFIFDKTSNDCKLFRGSLADFQNDCREIGYAVHPMYTECNTVFDEASDHACLVRTSLSDFWE